jgi:AcrR family transcriptional regulator
MPTAETSATTSLRERTRRAVRAELMEVGMALFARQGYEATTVEEVAQAAGMSKSSFFRYFPTKEDLVLDNLEHIGEELAEALAARPVDEPAWYSLRRAFDLIVGRMDDRHDRAQTLLRMLNSTPTLMAGQLARRSRWRDLLTPHLESRMAAAEPERARLQAAALAGAALACYEATQSAWLAADGLPQVEGMLDEAMGAIAPLSATHEERP